MTVTPADKSLTVHMPEAEVAGLAEGNPTGLIIAGIFAPVVAGVIIASPADEATAGRYVLDELLEEIDVEDFLDEDDDPPLIPDGGTSQTALEKSISEANKWQGSKLDKPLTTDDVVRVGRDTNGNLTYLTDMGKWKQSEEKQISGWRHIVERHVHPNSTHYRKFVYTDGYPTEPARRADEGPEPTMFPKDMTPDEIQNLIMKSAKSGHVVQSESDSFTKVIVWPVPKNSKYYNKYGIKEMRVVIRRKSGLIKTAFPTKGGINYGNISTSP